MTSNSAFALVIHNEMCFNKMLYSKAGIVIKMRDIV